MSIRLRPAQAADCPEMSALALRSKAAHGYDADFMAACRDVLTVRPGDLTRQEFMLAEDVGSGKLLGMVSLAVVQSHGQLEMLFVDPEAFGRGIGRRLTHWAMERGRDLALSHLDLDSDPGAEGFYLRLGAHRVGEVPSEAVAGRNLPRLRLDLSAR